MELPYSQCKLHVCLLITVQPEIFADAKFCEDSSEENSVFFYFRKTNMQHVMHVNLDYNNGQIVYSNLW